MINHISKYALLFTSVDKKTNTIRLPRSLSYQIFDTKEEAKEERERFIRQFENTPGISYRVEVLEVPRNWFNKRR